MTKMRLSVFLSVLALVIHLPAASAAHQEGEEETEGFTGDSNTREEEEAKSEPPPDDTTTTEGEEEKPVSLEHTRIRLAGGSNDSAIATPGARVDEATADFELRVLGYIRFMASAVQNDPEVSFVGRNDGFRLQNARVGFEGRLGQKVFVRITADGANDERDTPNDVEGTLRFGLADAFADVKLAPALELRAGRFPVIFDLERFVSAVQWGFISRSLESRGVSPTEGFETPGLGVSRNMGVAMRAPRAFSAGSLSLGYELAVQNGNGSRAAQNDNDAFAYSGSLISYFGDSLMLFGSFRYNERTEGELPFRRTERDLGTAFGAWLELNPVRIAGQLIFRRTTFPTTAAGSENAWGGHAEAVISVPGLDGATVGYRFALLDESDRMPMDRLMEHTAGAGYDMPSYNLRFKVNVTLPVEEAGRELSNARAEGLVEVQL